MVAQHPHMWGAARNAGHSHTALAGSLRQSHNAHSSHHGWNAWPHHTRARAMPHRATQPCSTCKQPQTITQRALVASRSERIVAHHQRMRLATRHAAHSHTALAGSLTQSPRAHLSHHEGNAVSHSIRACRRTERLSHITQACRIVAQHPGTQGTHCRATLGHVGARRTCPATAEHIFT